MYHVLCVVVTTVVLVSTSMAATNDVNATASPSPFQPPELNEWNSHLDLDPNYKFQPHTLFTLPYGYNDLEPVISEKALRLHHLGHHQNYVNKMNTIYEKISTEEEDFKYIGRASYEAILLNMEELPKAFHTVLNQNVGQVLNHELFFKSLTPPNKHKPLDPESLLYKAIVQNFDSFAEFQAYFEMVAVNHFGSGWTWLYVDKDTDGLVIWSTANELMPLMAGHYPLLTLDVWEHAYYVDYVNKRPEFIKQWWTIVNWKYVADRYAQFIQGSEERKKAAQLKKEQDEYIANKHKENAEVIQEALMDLQQEGIISDVERVDDSADTKKADGAKEQQVKQEL